MYRKIALFGTITGFGVFFILIFLGVYSASQVLIESPAGNSGHIVSILVLTGVFIFAGLFMLIRAGRMLRDDSYTNHRIQRSGLDHLVDPIDDSDEEGMESTEDEQSDNT